MDNMYIVEPWRRRRAFILLLIIFQVPGFLILFILFTWRTHSFKVDLYKNNLYITNIRFIQNQKIPIPYIHHMDNLPDLGYRYKSSISQFSWYGSKCNIWSINLQIYGCKKDDLMIFLSDSLTNQKTNPIYLGFHRITIFESIRNLQHRECTKYNLISFDDIDSFQTRYPKCFAAWNFMNSFNGISHFLVYLDNQSQTAIIIPDEIQNKVNANDLQIALDNDEIPFFIIVHKRKSAVYTKFSSLRIT